MQSKFHTLRTLREFILLWLTQSLSALGSAMTSFALVIWSYQQTGSALSTALLSISSYAPYVVMSIFAGAMSDKWDKKRTMLLCDLFAALTSVTVLILIKTGSLAIWHLYLINALNRLMNTIQNPASIVSVTLLVPKEHYQLVSGLQSFSRSLVTVLTPIFASAALALFGLDAVIAFDLSTCAVAMATLLLFIRIPGAPDNGEMHESVFAAAKAGLRYLKQNRGILDLILFLAAINFTASVYEAALAPLLLSRLNGGQAALGMVNASIGIATLAGSAIASLSPTPRSRVRVIMDSLLFSMSTENLMLAFGRTVPVWCLAGVLGWLFIPVMSANMDTLFRHTIPAEMQGRVYSARNTLQFFTIPLGYFLGGVLVDRVFEPLMAKVPGNCLIVQLIGSGKGSGAALLLLTLSVPGIMTCLFFRKDRHIWALER